MTFDAAHYMALMPEAILACATLLILMVGAFSAPTVAAGRVLVLSALSLIGAGVAAWFVYLPYQAQLAAPRLADGTGAMLVLDDFAFISKLLIYGVALVCLPLLSSFYRHIKAWAFEVPVLLLLSVTGMSIMVGAVDLLTMYLGLELMSFSLYILAASQRDNAHSSEAGLKYFVLGSLASGVLLFGMSLLYGATASTAFADIAPLVTSGEPLMMVALVLVTAALAFKVSAAPFHMWTPDVYQGAPTAVTAFMSSAPKVAAMVLLIRVLYDPLAALTEYWQPVIVLLAIASLVLGAVGAIVQSSFKRLLAYSAIAQIGFMLIGVVAASEAAVASVVFYLIIYCLMSVALFASILLLAQRNNLVTQLDALNGLGQAAPLVAVVLLINLFSLAGVPPFAGFFAKLVVFKAAVAAGFSWLVVVGVLASVIAAYYSLKIVRQMYFEEPHAGLTIRQEPLLWKIALLCTLGVVVFGIYPAPLMQLANLAVGSLF